jgi:hypothetical protein
MFKGFIISIFLSSLLFSSNDKLLDTNIDKIVIDSNNEYAQQKEYIRLLKIKANKAKFILEKEKLLRKSEFKIRMAVLEHKCVSKTQDKIGIDKCIEGFQKRLIRALKETNDYELDYSDYDLEKLRWKR